MFEFMCLLFQYIFSPGSLPTPEQCEAWEFQKHSLWLAF